MKFTIYATSERGYAVVKYFLEKYQYQINLVVENKDIWSPKLYQLAKNYNITIYQQNDKIPKADYIFVVCWHFLLPSSNNTIIFHDSFLPKYRGFCPTVNALINEEKELGVSAIFASENYDCGDIIAQQKITIEYPLKIAQAYQLLIPLYQQILDQIIEIIINGKELKGMPQNELEATYSLWRDQLDYLIDWNQSAEQIKRFVDAVGDPYEGAKIKVDGKFLSIKDVQILSDVHIINRTPGKVIFYRNGFPVIVCKKGLIQLDQILPKFKMRL